MASLCLAFPSPASRVHAARIDHALGEHGLQKSLIRSLGFSRRYGRRWVIDCREIANWKKGGGEETLPIGAGWGSFGRAAAGKLERIPHLVIGPGAAVSAARSFRNQDTRGNLYMVITNSCHCCEI